MGSAATSRSRRRLTPDDRRAEILRAARELFAQRPADLVSLEEVASAASASPALVHHYFGSKPQLASHVLRATADELTALLDPDPSAPAAVQLQRGLGIYLDYLQQHPHSWSALLRAGTGGSDSAAAAIAAEFDDHALALAVRAVAAPADRGPVLDLALRGWLAAIKDVCLRWLDEGAIERTQVETMLTVLFDGSLRAAVAADPDLAGCYRAFVSG